MTIIDLSQIPPPNVLEEKTVDELTQEWVTDLQGEDAVLFAGIQAGDPLFSYAQMFADQELKIIQRVNSSSREQFLSSAEGANIDGLGALSDTPRIVVDPSASPPVNESDDDYRGAVQRAPSTFGTGSRERYERAVLAADTRIGSVYAATPNPTELDVEWLPREGVDPLDHPEIEAAILLNLEASDVSGFQYRMLTDTVSIVEASVVSQDLTAHLNLTRQAISADAIAAATAAIEGYPIREVRKVIALSVLYDLLDVDGVLQVDLAIPAAGVGPTAATAYEWGTLTITAGVAPWL